MKPSENACKAALYGIPLFLAPFVDKLAPMFFNDEWPSAPVFVGCILLGTVSCCIGLRAFYDGSYERSKTGDTVFMTRQTQTKIIDTPTDKV